CPGSCRGLHLCKNFLFSGSCQYTPTRRGCLYSHTLDSAHNGQILKEHKLEHLSRAELCTLLLQSDDRLLPRICHDYNTGDGVFGGCQEGLACKRLHICERYLNRNCGCSRNHNFGVPHTLSILQGVPRGLGLKSVYANIQALKYHDIQSNKARGGNQKLRGGNRGRRGRGRGPQPSHPQKTSAPTEDKTEICKYFLRGHCKHQERCLKAHDKMPYRWETNRIGQWTPLPRNEAIEKDFCDPKQTYSSSSFPCINFDTMTRGPDKVRRIDAGSTEWLWYWEDEFGKWNMYASPDGGHKQADVDSCFLEQRFLADPNDGVIFRANSQKYSLSFRDMIQKNTYYGTKKLVRRRPRFVSAADVQEGRLSKRGERAHFSAVPNHWDKTQLPQTGYKRVPLMASSEEYQEVVALFRKTMAFHILKVERIQNKTLWDFFQLQKTQMKNSNGGRPVLEMKLFHGTDNQYVDTICHTNFDWRLCGSHGTAFGKGSYFAQNAKYSHSYTSDSNVRSMFVVRLLVGEYTKGSPEYRRPPSKDGGDINFYDSCVDDVHTPSIYVVFDKHQIYPEYLLQY
uniref:Si:ch73-252i11.1 n=1 Tax=Tetraodon nigroviridis TaxID=99883 RepID=H3CN79_TETNG